MSGGAGIIKENERKRATEIGMGSVLYEVITEDLSEKQMFEHSLMWLFGEVKSARSRGGTSLKFCFFSRDSLVLKMLPHFTISKGLYKAERGGSRL